MKIKAKDANEEVIEIEETDAVSVELTDEELANLKKLLPVADKLLALLSEQPKPEKDPEAEVEDEEGEIEGEEEEEEEMEDSVDEKGKKKKDKKDVGDSFNSVGAVHKKKPITDAEEEKQMSLENAWTKRYGGGK